MDIDGPSGGRRLAIVLAALIAMVGVGYAVWPSAQAAPVAVKYRPGPAPATQSSGTPGVTGPSTPAYTPPAPGGQATLHYISNSGPNVRPVAALGYNLFDLGPTKQVIDSLGAGQYALVWLGNLDNTNCTPGYSWPEFTAAVRRLAGDPKVFGYYISDEPHPSVCPSAAHDIRARADYIHAHDPSQKVFMVVMDAARLCGSAMGCEYRAMRPSITHVDLFGIDPFPCHVGAPCLDSRITTEVQRAAAAGIPVSRMVPVFQAFGQDCSKQKTKYYDEPSAADMTRLLAQWAALVPSPAFDFTYTWRSEGPACPGLDAATGGAHPDLQSVLRAHNRG